MWLLLPILACAPSAPPTHGPSSPSTTSTSPSTTTTTTTTPTTTTTTDFLPVGPTLTVEPLSLGATTPIIVASAPIDASVTVWKGTFDGSSCPPELAGGCIPIGSASPIASGSADAAGTLHTEWAVPATDPEGDYPVFVATADATYRSLPVMRRTWAGEPEDRNPWLLDLFDVDGWAIDEPPIPIGPGDWMDLALDGNGDLYEIFARGNEVLAGEAVFRSGLGDVLDSLSAPDASRDAILIEESEGMDNRVVLVEGHSMVTGTWTFWLDADYGEHQGFYDLSIRVAAPDEHRSWFVDADADSWGDPSTAVEAPVAPDGMWWRGSDCDDTDPHTNPDVWDTCEDGSDEDCTGTDKACHTAPDADGRVHWFASLQAELSSGGPYNISAPGDVDGDGVPELWARNGSWLWTIDARPGPVVTSPAPTTVAGWGMTRRGDFDHDGVPDLAFSATDLEPEGAILLAALPTSPATLEASSWATLVGREPGGDAGQTLDASGDVDGDGWPDLLVGGRETGTAWLVTEATPGTSSLDAVATAALEWAGEGYAWSSTNAADLDGDGRADIVVGTRRALDGPDQSTAYVVQGSLTGTLDVASTAAATVEFPYLLTEALPTGDTDGDGLDELLLAAPYWSAGQGTAWLFANPAGTLYETAASAVVTAPSGNGVAALADLDGDGQDDLVLASSEHYGSISRIDLFYGPLPAVATAPDDADVRLTPLEGTETGRHLQAGDFDRDGGDDVAIVGNTNTIDVIFGLP